LPYRGHTPGEWITCRCGEHFAVPLPTTRRVEPDPTPANRLLVRLVYGLGIAFLLSIPTYLIVMILRPFVPLPGNWPLWVVAGLGFVTGALLGERGLNAVGRAMRGTLERRI
jgi:hypothetical protein